MLNNYFKIFVRNLLKHRTASIINVAGLGLAIAACVFILLFVFDELKYDRFNENLDRIYRYTEQSKTTGERALIIPACNFSMITDNLPEFESGLRAAGQLYRFLSSRLHIFLLRVHLSSFQTVPARYSV